MDGSVGCTTIQFVVGWSKGCMCALARLGGCRRREVHRHRRVDTVARRGGDARVAAVRSLLELGADVEVPDGNGRRWSCYGRC